MPPASTTVGVERRIQLRVERPAPAPARLLVAANVLSLSRGVLAVALFAGAVVGAEIWVLVAIATVMWATDALDGVVARAGHRAGALPRADGAALDPMMDDLGFIAGFLILLDADVIPLAFAAFVFAARVTFAVIRFTGLTRQMEFARSEPLTKLNGATLAICQILLLIHMGASGGVLATEAFAASLILVMTATTLVSVAHFVGRRHGRLLLDLVRS
ncbi:MAG TPA: CDP-alcohol phosphatidyltransferase family protein [Solirubrobacteraceae bacterium]|jgi:phosphatidylglycerophosphate synthase